MKKVTLKGNIKGKRTPSRVFEEQVQEAADFIPQVPKSLEDTGIPLTFLINLLIDLPTAVAFILLFLLVGGIVALSIAALEELSVAVGVIGLATLGFLLGIDRLPLFGEINREVA